MAHVKHSHKVLLQAHGLHLNSLVQFFVLTVPTRLDLGGFVHMHLQHLILVMIKMPRMQKGQV